MTDPIEQAWDVYDRALDEVSTKADEDGQLVSEWYVARRGLTAAILRYHPDVVRLVEAARRWAANEDYHMGGGEQGVYDSAYLFASADLRAALAPFTTEEESE